MLCMCPAWLVASSLGTDRRPSEIHGSVWLCVLIRAPQPPRTSVPTQPRAPHAQPRPILAIVVLEDPASVERASVSMPPREDESFRRHLASPGPTSAVRHGHRHQQLRLFLNTLVVTSTRNKCVYHIFVLSIGSFLVPKICTQPLPRGHQCPWEVRGHSGHTLSYIAVWFDNEQDLIP